MIPIILKDYSWSQSKDMIYIRVNVKGVRANKTTFITSDNYIRLYFAPYYFEVFLWGEVDEVNGKCTLDEQDCQVLFELPKKLSNNTSTSTKKGLPSIHAGNGDSAAASSSSNNSSKEWPCLDLKELSKQQKNEIRTRAVEMSQKRAQNEIQVALQKRHENKQMSVQEQIRLDEETRQRIASIKSFETETFMEQMMAWQEEIDKLKETEMELMRKSGKFQEEVETFQNEIKVQHKESVKKLESDLKNISIAENVKSSSVSPGQKEFEKLFRNDESKSKKLTADPNLIWSNDEIKNMKQERAAKTNETKTHSKVKVDKVPRPVKSPIQANKSPPPVRQGGSIKVNFTPRHFPTPSRESTAAAEEEWLSKQLEARKNSGFCDENLKPEEKDPSWLLEKGKSLMATESYLGASTAFTTGLKLAPKLPQLLVGRAQAQLALNNLIKAVEDSSQAIELLQPKVSQNLKDRLDSHLVRGTAFRKLKMYSEAIGDYREALRLDPDNEELQEDYAKVQQEELNAANSEDE